MRRRDFIKQSALASAGLLLPSFLRASGSLLPLNNKRRLVVVQLGGGNDWLNTIIPYKNELYYKLRKKISIPQDKIIPLANDLALHPSLKALHAIFKENEMSIINNVGYPDPDRSHFRSMDIWHTASSGNEYLNHGWIGRFLDNECTNAYEAIEADNELALALRGEKMSGIAVKNLNFLYKELQQPFYSDLVAASQAQLQTGNNQDYLYELLRQTSTGINYVFEKNKLVSNNKEYPKNGFSHQLKNIASLIAAESTTKVYYISLNGFDTHVNQAQRHEKLLNTYAEGLSTFIANLKELGKWDDTLIMTFSEFGRRVEENASAGTDHGTAGNILLFGKNLKKKGIINELPDLSNLDDGDLKYSVDFRSVYKDILGNWMGADAEKIIPASVKRMEIV